ncbi:hypothetical protein L208DRAFT_1413568 [Tricholoma matsutake]|nr:hypothetical protein L208DRAFT_1413568 [Tricholoma matsutake 945]
MFLLSVAHLALVIQQIAVVEIFLATARTRVILGIIQFIIGDLVLIWRVWVVWGCNYWIPLGPLVIMIIAAGLLINFASLHEIRTFFIAAPSALIVANTTICTLLIAGRIWYAGYEVHRDVSGGRVYAAGQFPKTVILFIETGALYSASHAAALILNHVNSPGIPILLDLIIPLIGILPTLTIILVYFELVRSPQQSSSAPSRIMRFEELNTFTTSIVQSEDTRGPKSQAFNIV